MTTAIFYILLFYLVVVYLAGKAFRIEPFSGIEHREADTEGDEAGASS